MRSQLHTSWVLAIAALLVPLPAMVGADVDASGAEGRTVVVLLFDGLAPDLVEATETPALDRMRTEGAATHSMVPAFPTISLISGFTISTGCWPERHGIVTNRFYDPERGLYDHSADADWMTGCENLHEVAERQGVPSAALGWYGARSTERGPLASVVDPEGSFEDYPADSDRATDVVRLLGLADGERPRLILAYFLGPDGPAHFQGMNGDETLAAVRTADTAVGAVVTAIEALPPERAKQISLLVTTDHGMLPVSKLVNVVRILRKRGVDARVAATGSTAFVYLDEPAEIDAAVEALSGHEAFAVIRSDEQPEWSHLGSGPRAGDLILSSQPPYFIEDPSQWPWWLRWLQYIGPEWLDTEAVRATHGYPPGTPGVNGVLYAWGSGVATGRELGPVDSIDIHPTVTKLLGIEPGSPVDGRAIEALLR